jgi:hypothetical protein
MSLKKTTQFNACQSTIVLCAIGLCLLIESEAFKTKNSGLSEIMVFGMLDFIA